MSVCSDEMNAFQFRWKIENLDSAERQLFYSPPFFVQSLAKTQWYCAITHGGASFGVCRAEEGDGPGQIAVEFRFVLFGEKSKHVSKVQNKIFRKGDLHCVVFPEINNVLSIINTNKSICAICYIWKGRAEPQLPINSAFPRGCLGVTRINSYREKICARLDPRKLEILRMTNAFSEIIASAGRAPAFQACVTCALRDGSDQLHIEIVNIQYIRGPLVVYCTVSLLDKNLVLLLSKSQKLLLGHEVWKLPPFLRYDDLKDAKYLQFDLAIDRNQVFVEETYTQVCPERNATRLKTQPFDLQGSILSLYREKLYCDVTLKTADGSLEAHKTVLEASSPVFAKMLNLEFKEKDNRVVDIVDVDTPTLETFLEFLYTGKVADLDWEKVLRLYYVADKYQVLTLRDTCSSFLGDQLTIENICETLSLANRCHDTELNETSLEFLAAIRAARKDAISFFDSVQWEAFAKDNLEIAYSVVKSVYKMSQEKKVVGEPLVPASIRVQTQGSGPSS